MTRKPTLLVTRRLPAAVEARASRDYDVRLNGDDRPRAGGDVAALADGADAVLCCPAERMDAAAIAALPASVRILASFSVGTDHIDLDAARQRALVVTNTPGVLTEATADIALLLMLGAARRAGEGERLLRAGGWRGWAPTQLLGTHLGGRRLGIFGMGRIGRALARRARSLGMTIAYSNRARLTAKLEEGATYHADAEAMLGQIDVLSMHVPATPATRGWLDRRRLALLPAGAIVINTSRGAVVDDEALIEALRGGHLAAAGLDVFDGEPDLHPGYPGLENAFLLPHLGSATLDTRNAMGFRALDNLDAFFAGRTPPDQVG